MLDLEMLPPGDTALPPSFGDEAEPIAIRIDVSARFTFYLDQPSDILLQFEAADMPEQKLLSANCSVAGNTHPPRIPAQDGIGTRVWLNAEGDCAVEYHATVAVSRQVHDLQGLATVEPQALPQDAVQYLFDSRYCMGSEFSDFVQTQFGALSGGAQIAAMQQWIAQSVAYVPGSSNAQTTALDSFRDRQGVCRDFAHILIAMARACNIPARYVSLYDPGVTPQDFHAVAEVMLANPHKGNRPEWVMVDATYMAAPPRSVIIGVGRDAGDVSFMTVFGTADFQSLNVSASFAS